MSDLLLELGGMLVTLAMFGLLIGLAAWFAWNMVRSVKEKKK